MKNIDSEECRVWAERRGVAVSDNGTLYYPAEDRRFVRLRFPEKPSEIIPFARVIAGIDPDYLGSLLWITDFGIWSNEVETVGQEMIATPKSQGEGPSRLPDGRGSVFEEGELVAQQVQLVVPLTVAWDAYYIPKGKDYFTFICNDEYIGIVCRTEAMRAFWYEHSDNWRLV